jgi:competence protein ComFC
MIREPEFSAPMSIQMINGNWHQGWTLDVHTTASTRLPNGTFQTIRSPLGQRLYQLKYMDDRGQVMPLARTVASFVRRLRPHIDIAGIIAVPPSNLARPFQPVPALTSALGQILRLPAPADYLVKCRQTVPMKNVADAHTRVAQLQDAICVVDDRFRGRNVLLMDDLYRSGATMRAATSALMDQGSVARVYALALTRTRTIR